MENTTMTNREFYTAIVTANINEELTNHAQAQLDKMDAINAKRKENPAKNNKKAEENAPFKAAIAEALTAEAQTASAIAAIVGVSHNKVSALARQLVAEGIAESTDIKVPGKGTVKGYSLVG